MLQAQPYGAEIGGAEAPRGMNPVPQDLHRALLKPSFLGLLLLAGVAYGQYAAPKVLATVEIPKLNESSGVAASRTYPGVFWTHNDSGGGPYLYAFDRAGKSLGRWQVRGARSNDWEDIAVGPGRFLYIGDIGDNTRTRKHVTVYRVAEPDPRQPATWTSAAVAILLEYPDGPHDAECLMVHPRTGDIYIVTKARGSDTTTTVYRAAAPHSTTRKTMLERVGDIDLPDSPFTLVVGRITGGDISPDGTRVVLCDYFHVWEAVLPKGAREFNAIWKASWQKVDMGSRKQGEAVAYRHDGRAIVATSEGKTFPLIEAVRSR